MRQNYSIDAMLGEFVTKRQLDHHLKQISVRRGKRGQTFITRFVPLYLPLSGLRMGGCGGRREHGFGGKILIHTFCAIAVLLSRGLGSQLFWMDFGIGGFSGLIGWKSFDVRI